MITIIDYGVGNIFAFQNVFKRLNIPTKIARSKNDLDNAEKLLLPGVGSFDYALNQLNASGMREKLDYLVLGKKIPVIGICVGMQIMGNRSDEGSLEGLKWIDSEIIKSWAIVQFKPNAHKIAERNLKQQGMETFLPYENLTK